MPTPLVAGVVDLVNPTYCTPEFVGGVEFNSTKQQSVAALLALNVEPLYITPLVLTPGFGQVVLQA